MASHAPHMDDMDMAPARKAAKPPITANPAFPWIVALWFSALLGIGSLIMPVSLFESLVYATGIAAILPMAAPPLGFTAKLLIAIVGTVAGGMLGLLLARKLSAETSSGPTDHFEHADHLPTSESTVSTDLEDEHGDAPAEPAEPRLRRRSLAIEDEAEPVEFLAVSKTPTADIVPTISIDLGSPEPVGEPYELDEAAALTDEQSEMVQDGSEPQFEPQEPVEVAAPIPDDEDDVHSEDTMSDKQPFDVAFHVEPMAHIDDDNTSDVAPGPEEAEAGAEVTEQPVSELSDAEPANTEPGDPGESLLQLVNRLALAVEKHREWAAENAARNAETNVQDDEGPGLSAVEAGGPVPMDFEAAPAEDAAQALAGFFGDASPEGTIAAVSSGFDADEAGEEDADGDFADLSASFALPPLGEPDQPEPLPRPAFDQPPEGAEAPEADLEPVEADDPAASPEPTVLFPGNGQPRSEAPPAFDPAPPQPSNDDNERVLREALMNLQRMGK